MLSEKFRNGGDVRAGRHGKLGRDHASAPRADGAPAGPPVQDGPGVDTRSRMARTRHRLSSAPDLSRVERAPFLPALAGAPGGRAMSERKKNLASTDPLYAEALDFLYDEAELLDSGRFSEWLELMAED